MGPGISYRDWVSRAEVGGKLQLTSTAGTIVLPLENAQNKILREYASYSTNFPAFRLDFNGGVLEKNQWTYENGITVGCAGLFNLDIGLGGSVRVKVYADNDNATPVMNKSYVILTPNNFNLEFAQVKAFLVFDQIYSNVQRVEIEISSGVPVSKIGRIWIGNYMECCFDRGWGFAPESKSNLSYSSGEDAHSAFSRRKRKSRFGFSQIPYEKAWGTHSGVSIINTGTFNDLMMTVGKDAEIVIHPRTTDFVESAHPPLPTTMYGLVTKDNEILDQGGNLFETQIETVELI